MSGDASTTTTTEQDDADFAAGFNDDTTATPTATPAAQQDDADQGDSGEQAQAEPAPEYAQLTKAERDELIAAMREQMPKQFGTAFGKMGGLERWKATQEAAAAQAREIQSRLTDEKIARLRDDLPDFADGLEIIKSLQVIAGGGMDPDQLANLVAEKVSAVEQKLELRLLSKDHPDWKQIDGDPAFAAWVAAQPDEFKQNLAQASKTYDSAVVSDAMTKFKQSRKAAPPHAPTPDRASAFRNRAQAGVTPRGVGGNAAPNATDDLMAGFTE